MKVYKCNVCGNIVTMLEDSGVVPSCCGAPMTLLQANTDDMVSEKHVPVIEVDGSTVKVTIGSVMHPMTVNHMIEWIALETNRGLYITHVRASSTPVATYRLCADEKPEAAYAHCNLHGLWKAECKADCKAGRKKSCKAAPKPEDDGGCPACRIK